MDVRLEAFKVIHKDRLAELKAEHDAAWRYWKSSRHLERDLMRWALIRDKLDALGWVGARMLMNDWDEELGHARQHWDDGGWYKRAKWNATGEEPE